MSRFDLQPLLELDLGQPVGQLRAAPVNLGPDGQRGFLTAYAADFDVDPYVEMFFFPEDTLKIAMFDLQGKMLWRRDLGRGVVPGLWFCPVFPLDLDGDGRDEIWFVNNTDSKHPLSLNCAVLERIDSETGKTTGQWPWPNYARPQSMSHTFRNFIFGGYVKGQPVLVCAQGTYEDMYLQGWNPGMEKRWEIKIAADAPGARGSHRTAVVDINGDGVDEVLWGERCLSLDTGAELFCADRDTYKGHSDIADPLWDHASKQWYFYTCRESDDRGAPRVALYDAKGNRIWGAVDRGHMDMGWSARLKKDRGFISMSIRIGKKTCGPDGRFHQDMQEFTFDTLTGREIKLPFSVYRTVPVDFNGDGRHELVRGVASGNGEALDSNGNIIGQLGAPVALASKFMNHPGEQVLAYYPDGKLKAWGDKRAEDTDAAKARYAHPFYATNARLCATGYNLGMVAGI